MNWKQFLKPNMTKLVIFIVLMSTVNYFVISNTTIRDARILVGLPLAFWPVGSFFAQTGTSTPSVEFSAVNFFADLVFWYLVSCLISGVYDKFKKK
jgi:nitric oxide reductase large subunit